mmetsp:Transcript_38366/g.93173  ORF Transcript_38366/g.93173 Transcript_38366/m.93173 type:complete len:112 (-) Transcript_38366:1376-1711(-)
MDLPGGPKVKYFPPFEMMTESGKCAMIADAVGSIDRIWTEHVRRCSSFEPETKFNFIKSSLLALFGITPFYHRHFHHRTITMYDSHQQQNPCLAPICNVHVEHSWNGRASW